MGFRRSYLRRRAYTNGSAPCKVITSATSALSGASLPLQELWSRARVWGRTAKIARDLSSRALTCPIGIWSSRMCARLLAAGGIRVEVFSGEDPDPGRSRDNRQDEVPELAEEGEGQDTLGGLAMRTLPFQDEVRLRRISGDAAPGRRPNVR